MPWAIIFKKSSSMEENIDSFNFKEAVSQSEDIPLADNEHPKTGFRRFMRSLLIVFIVITVLVFLYCVPVYIAPALQTVWGRSRSECSPDLSLLKIKAIKKQVSRLDAEIQNLDQKLSGLIPSQSYMVINTVDNKFFLYKNRKLIRAGRCSSGKNSILVTPDGKVIDKFKTPRGCFSIQGKVDNPVWEKPDWAFIEDGLPIPKPGDPSRFEYNVLGDYAMTLGHGYMIHGTIYKRQLGMPVTHGCVRLNDEDLDIVVKNMNVGSKVYIY
jgi:hypothetical protein